MNTPITVLETMQQQGTQSTSSEVGEEGWGEVGGGSVEVEEFGGTVTVVVRGGGRTGSVGRREVVSVAVGTTGYLGKRGELGSGKD